MTSKRTVSELETPAFARGLLEAAPDAIVVVDEEGVIVLTNGQACALFGYTTDELVGQPVEMLMAERVREGHRRSRKHYVQAPRVRRMGTPASQLNGRRKDGTEFPIDISLSPFATSDRGFVISIIRDATERVAIELSLRHKSTHDALTGLYNRAFFDEELARLDRGRSMVTIVVADINGLKQANDRLGHESGDLLLRRAAAFIRAAFRAEDVVARLGGDEFAVLVPGAMKESLMAVLSRLRARVPAALGDAPELVVSLAVGCATGSPGKLSEALREADTEMYTDKRAGRGPSR